MASKFLRRLTWWIKFQHPASGDILRESLVTHDEARAELLRERLELEIALQAQTLKADKPVKDRQALWL